MLFGLFDRNDMAEGQNLMTLESWCVGLCCSERTSCAEVFVICFMFVLGLKCFFFFRMISQKQRNSQMNTKNKYIFQGTSSSPSQFDPERKL